MTQSSCSLSSARPSRVTKRGRPVWHLGSSSASGTSVCFIQTVQRPQLTIDQPKFIVPALEILPFLLRYAISMSVPQLRQYFFNTCHGFSVKYEVLASTDGAKFRQQCRERGKRLCAWTVNDREEMRECARWGIKSVISDKPALWMEIKAEVSDSSPSLSAEECGVDRKGSEAGVTAHDPDLRPAFSCKEEL